MSTADAHEKGRGRESPAPSLTRGFSPQIVLYPARYASVTTARSATVLRVGVEAILATGDRANRIVVLSSPRADNGRVRVGFDHYKSLQLDQQGALLYGRTRGDCHAFHGSLRGGAQLVFHFHRFHHDDSLTRFDAIADAHVDAHD